MSLTSSHQAKSKGLTGLHSFWGTWRGESVPGLFQLLEAAHIPWLVATSSASKGRLTPSHDTISLALCSWERLSAFKDPRDYIGATWRIQGHLPISGSSTVITSAKPLCHVRFQGLGCGRFRGAVLPPILLPLSWSWTGSLRSSF